MMNAVVFEHVRVAELPEDWRRRLAIPADARVTVHIEAEATEEAITPPAQDPSSNQSSSDPAFGIWRDREDMTDAGAHLRQLRTPRHRSDDSRSDG